MKRKIRFIDCGANIGQSIEWALEIFKNDEIKIDAFEPLPLNINVLKEKFNNHKNVTLHEEGVGIANGVATFYCQNWGTRTGSSLIKEKTNHGTITTMEIVTINLADWIKSNISNEEIVILKLDIEGEEYNVLPHLFENEIDKLIEYWLIEFHGSKIINRTNKNALHYENVEIEAAEKIKYLIDWGKPAIVKNVLIEIGLIT